MPLRRVVSRFDLDPASGFPTGPPPAEEHPIDTAYNAAHLLVLEGLEAVRKRPGMYIGSTDTRGLMHCLWEIIDNGVDEALAGAAHHVEVTLHPDDSVEVHDDGRGIPTDKEPRTGLPGVEVVATKLHAGGKFGGGSYVATGGLHGVGLSVVNALSARMDIDVDRSPSQQGISFRHGTPGCLRRRGPQGVVHREVRADPQGRPGGQEQVRHPHPVLAGPAGLHQGRPVRLRGPARPGPADGVHRARPRAGHPRPARARRCVEEKFRHDGGIAEFTDFLANDEPVTEILRLQGTDTFTETVPVLDDKGHMTPQEVERELEVDIALRWGTGYDTELRSFVNVIATPKGGTHVSGFEQGMLRTFNDAMKAAKVLKVNDDDVTKDDVLEGLTAVVTVRLAEPQFEGQTKEILGTPQVRAAVRKVVSAELKKFLTSTKRADKAQARLVMEKVAARGQDPDRRPPAPRDPAPQERPGVLGAAGQAGRLPGHRRPHRAVHRRGRLGARAPPSWPATPSSRRCCRSAARSSTSRRPRSATCSRTPSAARSSRWSGPAPAAPSTSRRPATTRSSSWPTPTPTARTSAACWPRCSSSTCPSSCTRAASTPPCPRCTASRSPTPRRGWTSTSTPTPTTSCSGSWPSWRRRACPGRTRSSATRASARWTPTSWPRPRWTRAAAPCAGSPSTTPRRPPQVFELLMGSDVAPRKEFLVQGAYEIDADHARRLSRSLTVAGAWPATSGPGTGRSRS